MLVFYSGWYLWDKYLKDTSKIHFILSGILVLKTIRYYQDMPFKLNNNAKWLFFIRDFIIFTTFVLLELIILNFAKEKERGNGGVFIRNLLFDRRIYY